MHVIACISKDGLEYYSLRFGPLKKVDCHEVARRVLRRLGAMYTLSDVVLILDNASCYRGFKKIFGESEFERPTLLRLDPYSPMLNPIENVSFAFKAEVKRFLTMRHELIIAQSPAGATIKAHHAHFLEQAADHALLFAATSILCGSCHLHTTRFYERV